MESYDKLCLLMGSSQTLVQCFGTKGVTPHPVYSKTCLKRPLKKKAKIVFQDQLSLNAGQKYCRMLQESILQYFRPALSYHLSLSPLFCLFMSFTGFTVFGML